MINKNYRVPVALYIGCAQFKMAVFDEKMSKDP